MVLSARFSNVFTIDIRYEKYIDIEYEQQHAEKKVASVTTSHSQSLQCPVGSSS